MLNDVVVDTNVIVHAQNPADTRFADSKTLLACFLEIRTSLCVDEGFEMDEARNRSHIGAEYRQHIHFGSLGFTVISYLAANGRIKQLPRLAARSASKRINQLLRNRRDRIFLSVAYNSADRVLVSHDYVDFQGSKRTSIKDQLRVRVIEASHCLGLL